MIDTIRAAAVLVVVAGAAIDARTHRLPNVLTFGGAALAFIVQGWLGGWSGLGWSVAGWATGTALFLPLFVLGGMGAGDVKLLGAVGAWLGPAGALWSAFFAVMAGGVLALVIGFRHGYLGKALTNLWGMLTFWRIAGVQPLPGLTLQDAPGPRLPYGVAIAAGTLVAIWLK